MLWYELRTRAAQFCGAGGPHAPLLGQILSLWVEEDPGIAAALKAKAVDRDVVVRALAAADYPAQHDHAVLNALRDLSPPVTVEAVVGLLIEKHGKHPAVTTLETCVGAKGAALLGVLGLMAAVSPSVVGATATTPWLSALTSDLSERAARGDFAALVAGPACLGLERALLKSRRGSAILTGPQGSGKTATVEALAHRIARGEAHPKLANVRILELSVGTLVANTQYRGQFSEKVEGLLKEVKAQKGTVILFVDEIHSVSGAGRVHGDSYDLGNALKGALSSGELRLIGTTTDTEFERYIAKDAAFARRFERIRLTPARGPELDAMLQRQVGQLAEKHGVGIPETVWREAVRLSDLHLANRAAQPDRALDLLDSACTVAGAVGGTLTVEHVMRSLVQTTGIPLDILEGGVRARLHHARGTMLQTVFGQEVLIERVLARLESNPLRLRAEARPLAAFLLTGDSGSGKSLLAEALAVALWGSTEALLPVHCGDFSEGGVAKLLGSPFPGLESATGCTGLLPEFLRDHTCGVLLFDELEKAHGALWDALLGLLDKGEVQCGDGRTYSARHFILVGTSNAVTSRELANPGLGFATRTPPLPSRQCIEARLTMFRKEFLNRFDDLLVTAPLSPSSQLAILRHQIAKASDRARAAGIAVPSDADLKTLLERHASAIRVEGGRALERLADDEVLGPLSRALSHACGASVPAAAVPAVDIAGEPQEANLIL